MTIPMQEIVQQLRKAVLVRDGAGLTDGQLLTLFVDKRDEDAFEALVRRHGPMVLGVCRRVLRNPHDAEDAFQATFLVLLRKAASVVPREMVANWLYGVARTTALRANTLIAKRRLRERQVKEIPDPEAMQPNLWLELRPVLDQELSRLPDKYRVAIVLCDLEGKSHKEAARQLGWPQGTVSGRLVRGRKMLANRLARHGMTVLGGALAEVLSQNATSALVPTSLVSSTVRAASLLAAGNAVATGLISVTAAALAKGVVITMLLNKLKTVTLVLMTAAIIGGMGLLYRTRAAEPAAPRAAASHLNDVKPPDDTSAETGSAERTSRNLWASSLWPRQALVHLDKGQLVVRTLEVTVEPVTVQFQGRTETSYENKEILRTNRYPTDMVKVYEVGGRSIDQKELPQHLKKETAVLVANDIQAADPLNLRLFREGTLLFILPSPIPEPAVAVPPPAVRPSWPAPLTEPIGPVAPLQAVDNSPVARAVTGMPVPIVVPPARNLKIPVHVSQETRDELLQVSLLASSDKGKTWKNVGTISPHEDSFTFYAPEDGVYWLVVQTLDLKGKAKPSDINDKLRPQLIVIVRTGN